MLEVRALTMDYRQFGSNGPKEAADADVSRRWWALSGAEQAASVSATLRHLKEQQVSRLIQHTISARLYGNLSMFALGATRLATAHSLMRERISYNVVQSAVDTVVAKMAKNKPRPLFLTSGGNYQQQRKAKKLNQFCDGVFYENRAYELGLDCFRDGAVVGDSFAHVFARNGRVAFERTLSTELWVDEIESVYGSPRQMHRTKAIDRQVMHEAAVTWAKDDKGERERIQAAIKEANAAKADSVGLAQVTSDLIEVRESWHLPNGPDATEDDDKGGRHVISIEGCVLVDEPWLRDHFPFARFRWCPRMFGFWSQGGAEQVQNIQIEINKLLQLIQRSFELGGSFKVFLKNGSKVSKEHINNAIGAVVNYSGETPPQYATPPMVQPEIFQHLLTLKNAAFEQFGVSQLSAASQKPAGLNSGVALREYNDIESDRFQTIGASYANFYLDLARLTVETAKEITGGRRAYKVKVPGKQFINEVDWRDVSLDEDSYVLQCYPVSALPKDPAGRLQTIQEYMQAGLINPRQGKKLLDFPDLDALENLSNAAEDYLSQVFDRMLDDGEYTTPEPQDDLQLAREMALEYYAHARIQRVEPERLELILRFLSQIDAMTQTAIAPPPTPQANPAAPPQSDLLSNAPGIQATA